MFTNVHNSHLQDDGRCGTNHLDIFYIFNQLYTRFVWQKKKVYYAYLYATIILNEVSLNL